ncbi:AMP-binding protein [Kitasatospora sp. NPDC054939]
MTAAGTAGEPAAGTPTGPAPELGAASGPVPPRPSAAEGEAALAVWYRQRGWWRDGTFLDDLRRQARLRPRKLAIAGRRISGARTDTLDYAELNRLTDRFAAALLELGVRRGDFVAVQLPNRWEMVPLIFACAAVGAVICPISPICPEEELRHRLGLTEARVAVTVPDWQGEPLAPVIAGLRPELPALEHVLVVGGPVPEGAADFHALVSARAAERERTPLPEDLALRADDPFVVLFTSGTTGESKGVLHSQNTLHAAARGYVDTFALDDGLVAAVSTPLVHYSGFVQGVLAGVLLGGTTVFQDERDNPALLDLVERYRATLLYGPPATLADVRDAQRAEPRDVGSLRRVVIGSAQVLPYLVDDLWETLGTRTYSLWGMSENGPVTVTRPAEPFDWAAHSNGRPIDAMEVRIDPTGVPGDPAGSGRLRVRGAGQCLGYYKRDDVYAAELGADGWFDTGDLARHDGAGGIRIIGRAKDAIRRGGRIVPVVELEAALARHPAVAEAALVGLPPEAAPEAAPDGGEQDAVILAVVVAAPGGPAPTPAELAGAVRAAGYGDLFVPGRVEVLARLPKTLTGKVRKAQLRARYSAPAADSADGASAAAADGGR